jgi:hypothetical protein
MIRLTLSFAAIMSLATGSNHEHSQGVVSTHGIADAKRVFP